jgi:hypothetical protein
MGTMLIRSIEREEAVRKLTAHGPVVIIISKEEEIETPTSTDKVSIYEVNTDNMVDIKSTIRKIVGLKIPKEDDEFLIHEDLISLGKSLNKRIVLVFKEIPADSELFFDTFRTISSNVASCKVVTKCNDRKKFNSTRFDASSDATFYEVKS